MKVLCEFVVLLVFGLGIPVASGQNVIEISKPEISTESRKVMEKILPMRSEGLNTGQLQKGIGFLEESLKTSDNQYDRYMITFYLTFFYAQANEHEKCFNLLEASQQEGFFFPTVLVGRTWPKYLLELKKLERFDTWFQENKRREEQAQKNAKAEFFVQTPSGYSKDKTYPLLIVFHGGVDSHIHSYYRWQSPTLKSEYIVVYVQGSQAQGSFLRRFGQQWQNAVGQAYKQIIQKYSVDTKRVLVGGPSAGGAMSITIVQDQIIPVAGAILAFPVKPRDFDEAKLKQAAERGVCVALLGGENDFAIKQQKEIGVAFDKAGLPNRFVVFPNISHEFPKDFHTQIDISLEFIWNK
jgi:predicted esterase